MDDSNQRYFNRELSWLEFNQRVLDEARDLSNPLLERVKFLAITASNLDEFFMVRVGGLQLLAQAGATSLDPSGMTPAQQLDAVRERTLKMVEDQYRCLYEIEELLVDFGIRRMTPSTISESQRQMLEQSHGDDIVSVHTPLAARIDAMPHLQGGTLYLCVRLKGETSFGEATGADDTREDRFALIPLSRNLPRLLTLPSDKGFEFLTLEHALSMLLERFFPRDEILEQVAFRITRNADMSVREDSAEDLMSGMKEVLLERHWSDCVRLELDAGASNEVRSFLSQALSVDKSEIYEIPGPLHLGAWMSLTSLHGYESAKAEPWSPQASPLLPASEDPFPLIAQHSVLLCHPFESFDPVLRLLDRAADDPDVLAIKQTLYRTSKESPIIKALARAAEKGKNVTALVELKARFDEQRNIDWARQLETAGVHVIHGVKGLKTHAKICIIVKREPQGVQRYVHFGTGNYNEATSRLYSDISYFTADEDLGADAIAFFNAISGYSEPLPYRRIEAAPLGLREKLLELIDIEIQRKQEGMKASITAKFNSLVDPALIEALYAASQAGVEVRLNIRGICCLRPGVPGLSEKIHVISIVDRFLEHARIMHFHHGGDDLVFISSADWMQRNLDKRIELLVPIDDHDCRRRLIEILETYFRDNVKARVLMADGSFRRVRDLPDNRGKNQAMFRSQLELWRKAAEAAAQHDQARLTRFEPHQRPDDLT